MPELITDVQILKENNAFKLEQAKHYLGTKWCAHPESTFVPKGPTVLDQFCFQLQHRGKGNKHASDSR